MVVPMVVAESGTTDFDVDVIGRLAFPLLPLSFSRSFFHSLSLCLSLSLYRLFYSGIFSFFFLDSFLPSYFRWHVWWEEKKKGPSPVWHHPTVHCGTYQIESSILRLLPISSDLYVLIATTWVGFGSDWLFFSADFRTATDSVATSSRSRRQRLASFVPRLAFVWAACQVTCFLVLKLPNSFVSFYFFFSFFSFFCSCSEPPSPPSLF